MWKTTLILPDGTAISSGVTGESAVKSATLTQRVNEGRELTAGSVCAAMAELTILTRGEFTISPGDEITIYRENAEGAREDFGIFLAQEPQHTSQYLMKLTAYDRVTLLDRDLTGWLESLPGWPYTLQEFAGMVCNACGLPLAEGTIPNGDHPVRPFTGSGITGRQIIRWIGELAGRFCICNPKGELEFSWYRQTDTRLTPTGERYYFGFSREDYATTPIQKLQIRQGQEDVGTVFPPEPEGDHAYQITANPLAPADSSGSLIGIAQTLFEQLQPVTYTPCKIKIPAQTGISCGDILQVADGDGREYTVYVMSRKQSGDKETLECTGSVRRDSTTAVNQVSYRTLTGKMLNIQAAVEGLKVENRDASGKIASLQMDVDGIASEVSRQQTELGSVRTQLTQIAQTAENVDIRIRQMDEEGVQKVKTETGFTFDAKGLTISREGSRIENLVNETGMYVRRSGEVILKADQDGVTAVDVSARNYLIVGEHARFEDYSSSVDTKRTACFWI